MVTVLKSLGQQRRQDTKMKTDHDMCHEGGEKSSVNSEEEGALLGGVDQERRLSIYEYQQQNKATYTK